MSSFAPLIRFAAAVDDLASVTWFRWKLRHGRLEPVRLSPYRGNGTTASWTVRGRLVEASAVEHGSEDEPWWRNAATAVRRFVAADVPGGLVRAGEDGVEVVTDVEGYFVAELPADGRTGWIDVPLELLGPTAPGQQTVRASAPVLVPEQDAEFGIISDLDDTVIWSGIISTLTMLKLVLFHNASTRTPFPGVGALYRALQRGPDDKGRNPVFYVSSSPWNLYDLLERFLELHDIPAGPLFLTDWGLDAGKLMREETKAFKLNRIGELLATYPELDFVLIGDSGQHDPEIYEQAVIQHPGRIRAVYIRDVARDERDAQVHTVAERMRIAGVPTLLMSDSVAAAEHARSEGLLSEAGLTAVQEALPSA